MEYPVYEQMKYSGVDYLGDVPNHWETRRLKFYSERVYTGSTPPSNESEYYLAPTEDWFTPSDFSDDKLKLTNSNRKLSAKAVEDGVVKRFPGKSILVVGIGATLGKIGLADSPFLCNQQINVIIPSKNMDANFLSYSLRVKVEVMQIISNATTLGIMNQEKTKLIEISAPEKEEQTQIAKFLDYKTAQIDRLIEKKKALIENLNEQRIAMITQAVTKGLNPDAPMKDSEVDWLGEVPDHWEVMKLRFLLNESLANGIFKKSEFWGQGTKVINVTDVYVHNDIIKINQLDRLSCDKDEVKKYSAKHGDFFLVRSSLKLEGIGKSATVLEPTEDLVFECHVVRGRPNLEAINPRFLNLLLNSKYAISNFIAKSNIVTMATIDQEKFKSLFLGVPPLDEQQEICDHVDSTLGKIDGMVSVTNKTIDKLNEYRTSLITAAVTGKIDVREVETPKQGAA